MYHDSTGDSPGVAPSRFAHAGAATFPGSPAPEHEYVYPMITFRSRGACMGMRLGLATHAMIDLVSFPDQTRVVVTPTQQTTGVENLLFDIQIQNMRLESL